MHDIEKLIQNIVAVRQEFNQDDSRCCDCEFDEWFKYNSNRQTLLHWQ